jgi:hypothetical protein
MPRPKERIKPLLENIEKIWLTQPDLRLGQLISIMSSSFNDYRKNTDLFYFEDKDLEIGIEKYKKMHNIK